MALEKFACEPQLLQRVASHFEDPKAQLEDPGLGGRGSSPFWEPG